MKIRSTLMVAIKRIIRERGLTQTAAAELFGTTQPRITDIMRGHIDEFTIDSLVNMLGHAGIHPMVQVSTEIAQRHPRKKVQH